MPIHTMQQKSRELGRIRVGAQVATAKGGSRPVKLDAFRFTTNSPTVADAVAAMFGGTVEAWADGPAAWQVFTTATVFDVMVPPGEAALSQWFELWSGGGCQRRCDGITEQLKQTPCVCPADTTDRMIAAQTGGACKPTTRVNVILPDLPDIGVWRYESHGYYAAMDLGATAELLGRAREAGVIVPAKMRLLQREIKRDGKTMRFPNVVLEIGATLRELATASGPQSLLEALPPAPTGAKAIAAPQPSPAGPSPVTAGEAPDPEKVAAEARTCEDLKRLEYLAIEVRAAGLHDVMVTDDGETYEQLWDVLIGRRDHLIKRGAA